jgi:hypothetical protein
VSDLLGLLLFVSFLAIFGGVIAGIGIVVFGPLDRAARGRQCPTQFTIVDFFCLIFIIQAPTALIHGGFLDNGLVGMIWVFDAFAWFSCGMVWLKSVQVMSRAGIEKPWHRVIFLAFIVPVSLVGVIGGPILAMVLIFSIVEYDTGPLPIALALSAALIIGLALSAYFTRAMVAASPFPEAEGDPDNARPLLAATIAAGEDQPKPPSVTQEIAAREITYGPECVD